MHARGRDGGENARQIEGWWRECTAERGMVERMHARGRDGGENAR